MWKSDAIRMRGILPPMPARRAKRAYDPRLVHLVQTTGDITLATREGVPRSTASGSLRAARRDVVTAGVLGNDVEALAARVIRLERSVRQLLAVLRLLVALLQVLEVDLARRRIPRAADKGRLLQAIERTRGVLVAFYVKEHKEHIPHAAFQGQTPDEMYLGTGDHVPAELVVARAAARRRRLEVHRARTRCSVCE